MTEEYLKLTTYLGERRRAGHQFAADALLDLYERERIESSIVLRGIEGFGLNHQLRTDETLTLSEDLPLVTIAVDTRSRIEAVAGQAIEVAAPGLVTLERARFTSGLDLSNGDAIPAGPGESAKLTVYLGRQERAGREPAFAAVCDLLYRRGLAGATTLLGVDGTVGGTRQRARFLSRNADVPVMIISVGAAEHIRLILPELGGLLRRPLLTLERVTICRRDGRALAEPAALAPTGEDGLALWHKLMVYTSEAALHDGQPVHRALTRRLRAAGLSGATTLRGIWGFHGDHRPHGDQLLRARRHVPTVSIIIGSPEESPAALEIISELTAERGLVTSETIPALRAAAGPHERGGLRVAEHHLRPPAAAE